VEEASYGRALSDENNYKSVFYTIHLYSVGCATCETSRCALHRTEDHQTPSLSTNENFNLSRATPSRHLWSHHHISSQVHAG
jgi:hypothetical protein